MFYLTACQYCSLRAASVQFVLKNWVTVIIIHICMYIWCYKTILKQNYDFIRTLLTFICNVFSYDVDPLPFSVTQEIQICQSSYQY